MEIQLFMTKPSDAISKCFPLDIEAEFLSFRQFHSHFEWHCFIIIFCCCCCPNQFQSSVSRLFHSCLGGLWSQVGPLLMFRASDHRWPFNLAKFGKSRTDPINVCVFTSSISSSLNLFNLQIGKKWKRAPTKIQFAIFCSLRKEEKKILYFIDEKLGGGHRSSGSLPRLDLARNRNSDFRKPKHRFLSTYGNYLFD